MAFDPRNTDAHSVLKTLVDDIEQNTRIRDRAAYKNARHWLRWEREADAIALKLGQLLSDPHVTFTPELEKLLHKASTTWSDIDQRWVRARYILDKRGIVWPPPE